MELVILAALFIAWRISKKCNSSPCKRRNAAPPNRSAPPGKAAAAERKAALQKNLAYYDALTAKQEIEKLNILLDIAQEDYYSGPTSQQEKALRKIISLEKRIAAAETRLEKAKYKYLSADG